MIERTNASFGPLLIMVFLFGGAIGYIVRDVRADTQVKEAAVEARREIQQTAASTLQRVQQAGAALGDGVKATAESTKAAFTAPR